MKYNAHKFISTTLLVAILYILTSFPLANFVGSAMAACSGTGCNGLFPNSSGCDTNGTQSILAQILPASAQVDLRYSSGCKTVWARTTNVDYPYGRSFYLNATLKGVLHCFISRSSSPRASSIYSATLCSFSPNVYTSLWESWY